MKDKLRKLVGLISLFVVIIAAIYFFSLHSEETKHVPLDNLKQIGFLDAKTYTNILYNDDEYTLLWNNRSNLGNRELRSVNEDPTLCFIPTTQSPNKDAFLNQKTWRMPTVQSNNVNYFM